MDKQMVSTFMEITACESQAYAVQHLGSCRWNLDDAISLYFNSGGGGAGPSAVSAPVPPEEEVAIKEDDDNYDAGFGGDDGVRAPIPSRVEALYEDDAHYGNHDVPYVGFGEELYPPPMPTFHAEPGEIAATGWEEAGIGDGGHVGAEDVDWGEFQQDAEQEDSREEDSDRDIYSDNEVDDDYGFEMDEDEYYASIEEDGTEDDAGEQPRPAQLPPHQDALDALYQRPVDLMFVGSFHDAKVRAARDDRFLLVNLQTLVGAGHFQSMLHNRDLWSDEQVKNAVKESFVLFLAQKKSTNNYHYMDQCSKLCSFYSLEDDQLPAVLILEPITGKLLNKWSGPMTPDEFMEYVDAYTKKKPSTEFLPKFVERTSVPVVVAGDQLAATEHSKPENPENAAPAGANCSEQEPVQAPEAEPPTQMVDDDEEEPMEGEKIYKLRIRFPDGSLVPKEFGCRRRVALLFAFVKSAMRGGGEAAAERKAFRITRFAGRGFEAVQADGGATFEDLGLNCATVSVVFET